MKEELLKTLRGMAVIALVMVGLVAVLQLLPGAEEDTQPPRKRPRPAAPPPSPVPKVAPKVVKRDQAREAADRKELARLAEVERKRVAKMVEAQKKEAARLAEVERKERELLAERAARTYNDAFYLAGHHFIREEYSGYVSGIVQNVSSQSFSLVYIEINLFDESGNVVGSTIDSVHNLEPGQTWKFKALVTEDGATHCIVKDISGR